MKGNQKKQYRQIIINELHFDECFKLCDRKWSKWAAPAFHEAFLFLLWLGFFILSNKKWFSASRFLIAETSLRLFKLSNLIQRNFQRPVFVVVSSDFNMWTKNSWIWFELWICADGETRKYSDEMREKTNEKTSALNLFRNNFSDD